MDASKKPAAGGWCCKHVVEAAPLLVLLEGRETERGKEIQTQSHSTSMDQGKPGSSLVYIGGHLLHSFDDLVSMYIIATGHLCCALRQ